MLSLLWLRAYFAQGKVWHVLRVQRFSGLPVYQKCKELKDNIEEHTVAI